MRALDHFHSLSAQCPWECGVLIVVCVDNIELITASVDNVLVCVHLCSQCAYMLYCQCVWVCVCHNHLPTPMYPH